LAANINRIALNPLDRDGQNRISRRENHGDIEQAKAPSLLRFMGESRMSNQSNHLRIIER